MNIKGIYVNLSSINPGVNNKIKSIVKSIDSYEGISCELILPGYKQNNELIDDNGFKYLELSIYSSKKVLFYFEKLFVVFSPFKFIRVWKFKKMFFKALLKFQIENNISYSIVRYPFASYSFLNFLKSSSSNVYIEFNTFEFKEFKSQNRFFFLSLKYYLERILRKKILQNSEGFIGVTNEIISYQDQFIDIKSKPKFLISNGLGNGPNRLIFHKEINPINFVVLIGQDQPWHGIDRLIFSLEDFPLETKAIINVIGKLSKNSLELINKTPIKNVSFRFLGLVSSYELHSLLEKTHIGIGSLCLFRKGMKEACPLKVRDFALNGLPVVIGYNDTDFSNNQTLNKFTFQVENSDSTIDFNKVISWYEQFSLDDLKKFSENAYDILSYQKKVMPFVDYLKSKK